VGLAGRAIEDRFATGLPVHILSAADFENSDFMTLVVDEVDNSVLALAYAIAIGVPGKFLRSFRARIDAQHLNSLDDAPPFHFCA